ncbi:MAG: hypothetical protein AB4057_07385 [Crocosphaera sp.]
MSRLLRSLSVAEIHKDKLEYALIRKGYATQKLFAEDMQLSLSTINKFFNCKPIDKLNFIEICHQLDLDWNVMSSSNFDTDPDKNKRSTQSKPIPKRQSKIRISLEATIDDFNKEMLDEFIKLVQEKSLDVSLKITKIEE